MVEKIKCTAYGCTSAALGEISLYGDSPYCGAHLESLAKMNSSKRPKPVITYFPIGYQPLPVTQSESSPIIFPTRPLETGAEFISKNESNNISEPLKKWPTDPLTPIVTANTNNHLPKIDKKIQTRATRKSSFKWIAGILLMIVLGGILTANNSAQSHKAAINALAARNEVAGTCVTLDQEEWAAESGPIGSSKRLDAVNSFYDKVLKSTCVEWGDGTILKNPFFGATSTSFNWQQLQNAYLYTLQRWNGVEDYSLHCRDGWNSQSIGKSGACSHHGGVTSGFNEFKDWNLINHLNSGEVIYPPLDDMTAATQK